MECEGKIALVTGAGSGIGSATARALAKHGVAALMLADRDQAGLARTAADIEKLGVRAVQSIVDLRHPDQVSKLFAEAEQQLGRLDIVHNNAGIMSGGNDLTDAPLEGMIDTVRVNLLATIIGSRLAIDSMRRRGGPGVIVNTASLAALTPLPADPVYAASKAAVLMFTRSCKPLAEQFGIRVMAVCPGIVDTNIIPHEAEWLKPALAEWKMLRPEEIAEAVLEAVRDDSKSGEYIVVTNTERNP